MPLQKCNMYRNIHTNNLHAYTTIHTSIYTTDKSMLYTYLYLLCLNLYADL